MSGHVSCDENGCPIWPSRAVLETYRTFGGSIDRQAHRSARDPLPPGGHGCGHSAPTPKASGSRPPTHCGDPPSSRGHLRPEEPRSRAVLQNWKGGMGNWKPRHISMRGNSTNNLGISPKYMKKIQSIE